MNTRLNGLFSIFVFLAVTFSLSGQAFAAERLPQERKQVPVDIQAGEQRRIEDLKGIPQAPKIEEKERKMPEIPKKITREKLGAAEQARLAELETKRAKGQITETEYDLEKDTLFRDSNIQF